MRTLRSIVAIALLLAGPAVAAAQGSDEASIERAREHMDRGQALYLQGRFEEAAMAFEAAFEAQPFSAFLYNAGVALERAGRPARAARYLERYLSQESPSAAERRELLERIERLRTAAREATETPAEDPPAEDPPAEDPPAEDAVSPETTEATPSDPPETEPDSTGEATTESDAPDPPPEELFKSLLSVRTNPEGATVTVTAEGEAVAEGPGPFAHTLDAGRYSLRVSHPDFQTVEQALRVEPGKVYMIIVEMSQGQFLGYLRVVSDPPGAQVLIDDREAGPRGETPFAAPMPVGAHRVWVERPGFVSTEQETEIGVGEDVTLRVQLERVAYGRLRVTGNIRGASVLVDGEVVGEVPFEGQVPAGDRQVRVESDGMKAYEAEVEISRGQLTPLRVRLRPAPGRGAAVATSIFTALVLGGGITLGVLGWDFEQQLRSSAEAGRLSSDDQRLDLGFIFYVAADAAFGMSLILAGLTLYYLFNDPLPDSEGRVMETRDWALAPLADPVTQTAGMWLGGDF